MQTDTALAPLAPSTWQYMGDTMDSAGKLAHALVNTGLAPQNMTAPQAFYILLAGAELGLRGPVESLRHLNIVKGKVATSAEIMRAKMLEGGCTIEFPRMDAKGATIRVKRPGGNPQEFTFDENDAKRAGLLSKGGSWDTYPMSMYVARVTSLAARTLCPDMIRGASYTPEEIIEDADAVAVDPEPIVPPRGNGTRTNRVKAMLEQTPEAASVASPEVATSVAEPKQARLASDAIASGAATDAMSTATDGASEADAASEDVFPDAPSSSLGERLADAAVRAQMVDPSTGRTIIPPSVAAEYGIKAGKFTVDQIVRTGAGFEILHWLESLVAQRA